MALAKSIGVKTGGRPPRADGPFAALASATRRIMTERSQGHAAGDAMLATVAQTMRNSLRAGDIIARSGGDEFLIVLALPTEEAGRVMTRIIGELPIGASYGVAPLRDFRRFDEAVAVADAEMYLDKTHKETHGPKLPA